MLVSLYIFFQLVVIVMFFMAFFNKQELIWALTLVFSGVLMFSSFDIQVITSAGELVSYPYIYLAWINMIFFALSVILGLFDMFDKYGIRFGKDKEDE